MEKDLDTLKGLVNSSRKCETRTGKEKYNQVIQNIINDSIQIRNFCNNDMNSFIYKVNGKGYLNLRLIQTNYITRFIVTLSNIVMSEMYDDFEPYIDYDFWHDVPCRCNECFRKDKKARYQRYLKRMKAINSFN